MRGGCALGPVPLALGDVQLLPAAHASHVRQFAKTCENDERALQCMHVAAAAQ